MRLCIGIHGDQCSLQSPICWPHLDSFKQCAHITNVCIQKYSDLIYMLPLTLWLSPCHSVSARVLNEFRVPIYFAFERKKYSFLFNYLCTIFASIYPRGSFLTRYSLFRYLFTRSESIIELRRDKTICLENKLTFRVNYGFFGRYRLTECIVFT